MGKLPKQLEGFQEAVGILDVEQEYVNHVYGELLKLEEELGPSRGHLLEFFEDTSVKDRDSWASKGVPYRTQEELVNVIVQYMVNIDTPNREFQSLDMYLDTRCLVEGLKCRIGAERENFDSLQY
ncbi:hypothetical protein K8R33_00810 [archaeon]|nr:hypothetical protein [archaeon]